ncbi:MAG: hypothetical protein HOP07_04900 [Bacteriovoracaceae bacterium]|nr:hypothetical protein [Bacteriovoracaceae bacterium]
MKSMFFCLVLILNLTFPAFAIETSQDVFNSKWNYTPLLSQTENESTLQMKLFKRVFWINKTEIPIAETTFTFLKNPKEKTMLLDLGKNIQKSFGTVGFIVSGDESNVLVEGHYKKINRFIKIHLKLKDNNVTIVSSFIRSGFKKNLDMEIDELHSVLLSYNGDSVDKTSWINQFQKFIIKDANAAGIDYKSIFSSSNISMPPSSLGTPSPSLINFNLSTTGLQESTDNLTNQIGATNTQLGNANVNWAGTNLRLGDANSNWSGTNMRLGDANTQLGNANNNWAGTNLRLGDANTQLGNANTNWASTNTQIQAANANLADFNKQYGSMNTNWAESNKLLGKMMDPNHMAKVGFYTAAGAALGAVTVNLAVEGVSAGISFLHELFTGSKKKKLEWEDFEKAMSLWDNQLSYLVKMEQAVDSYLAAFDFFDGKNLSNYYLKQLTDAMRDMRFDRDLFTEKFKDQSLDVSCRKVFHSAADELDQKIKEYDEIIKFATKNNLSINGGANYFCNQLKELQRKILSAENQMQDIRLKILLAENQFYGKQETELESRDDKMEDINGKLSKTIQSKNKYDQVISERQSEKEKAGKDEWVDSCLDGKNDQGAKINAEFKGSFLGGIFTHFKRKSLCNTAFENISKQELARSQKSLDILSAEEEMRKSLKLKTNSYVDMKLSEEQMSWMARLHIDAYCFQFAHQSSEKIPAKCNEYPELLYSMSLSKGHEKAKRAYDSKCQDRYLQGIKRIAQDAAK